MKTLITTQFLSLLLAMFVGLSLAKGQARIGSTAGQIRTEFEAQGRTVDSRIDTDGELIYNIKFDVCSVYYYFNSNNVCYITAIFPNNQGGLNGFVEQYNQKYVIVSDRKWKMYSSGGINTIELVFEENGLYYFVWR